MKNKKLLIIPIVLIILLVLGAGISAIIYFQTDLFKSPKQLFFKYLGNSFDFDKEFDYDKSLLEYKEQSEKSYTSNGDITLSFNYDESQNDLSNYKNSSSSNVRSSSENIMNNFKDALDKTKIEYSAKSIPTKQKYHMNIKPIYNNTEITNLELLSSGDNYGIKINDLYDKYIYVENNNLKEFASKLGINSNTIPDKIKKRNMYELLYIAPETRKQISKKYTNFLDKKLTKDMFTKQKNVSTSVNGEDVTANSYTLTLNGEQTHNILTSFLQELKDDDLTLDLLIQKLEQSGAKESFEAGYNTVSSYSLSSSTYNSSKKQKITLDKDYLKTIIQEMIDELNDDKDSFDSNEKVSFTVYSYKGNFVKFEITNSEDTDKMSIEKTTNKNEKVITLNYNETTALKANYTFSKNKTSLVMNIYDDGNEIAVINADYEKDKTRLNFKSENDDTNIEINIETNGEIKKGNVTTTGFMNINTSDTQLNLNINHNTTYTDDINIDDLSANNGELLNEMSNTKINSLITEISNNFKKVVQEKADILGIDIPNNTINNNNNINNINDLTGYTTYIHPSGVQFSYPENWKSLGTSDNKPIFSNSENGTNVNLLYETIPAGYDLKSYMDKSISGIKNQLSSQIEGDINQNYVNLNGKDASIISYTMVQSNTKVSIKQACFIDDNTAYILTIGTLQNNNNENSEIINNIINSFKK